MLSTERLVRSARFWSRCSLSLVIERETFTGMEVNKDFTSKETMISSLEMECCFIYCVKTEVFCTVKVIFGYCIRRTTDTACDGSQWPSRFVDFRITMLLYISVNREFIKRAITFQRLSRGMLKYPELIQ